MSCFGVWFIVWMILREVALLGKIQSRCDGVGSEVIGRIFGAAEATEIGLVHQVAAGDPEAEAATVFRGLEGYGETPEIHRHRLIEKDQPVVVTIVDTPEDLERLIPEVEAMMETGMIAASDVEYIRIEKPPANSAPPG
jgi:PII-like signaling protein